MLPPRGRNPPDLEIGLCCDIVREKRRGCGMTITKQIKGGAKKRCLVGGPYVQMYVYRAVTVPYSTLPGIIQFVYCRVTLMVYCSVICCTY